MALPDSAASVAPVASLAMRNGQAGRRRRGSEFGPAIATMLFMARLAPRIGTTWAIVLAFFTWVSAMACGGKSTSVGSGGGSATGGSAGTGGSAVDDKCVDRGAGALGEYWVNNCAGCLGLDCTAGRTCEASLHMAADWNGSYHCGCVDGHMACCTQGGGGHGGGRRPPFAISVPIRDQNVLRSVPLRVRRAP
jgi:hypothetical protein